MQRPIIIRDLASRCRLLGMISKLDQEKAWEVTVRPHKAKRTIDQNSLYWSWLSVIADDTGNTANDVHEWCRAEFLPPSFVKFGGRTHQFWPSTTKLNTKEMTDYLNRIEAWAASQLGIVLPHPDDQGRVTA